MNDAHDERRERYAAAMALRDGHPEWPPEFEDDERDYLRRADAAMAVADEELAKQVRLHMMQATMMIETHRENLRLREENEHLRQISRHEWEETSRSQNAETKTCIENARLRATIERVRESADGLISEVDQEIIWTALGERQC